MTIRRMSNPQNFCKEANKLNIRYEFLIEAKKCIGEQSLARLFKGNSLRGGGGSISAATINNWIETFEYIKKNPTHEDNDQYVSHRLEPKNEYYDYLKIIKEPIVNDIAESWKKLPNKKLGDEAAKYGMTLGIRNSKSIKTLLDRMILMIERRKKNIWINDYTQIEKNEKDFDYHFTNVSELRRLCKERNLKNAHLKTKEELIELLKNNPNNIYENSDIINYDKLSVKELKTLAKERGLTMYNNLKKDELVKLHKDYDEDVKMIEDDITHNEDSKEEIINIQNKVNNETTTLNKNNNFLKVFTFDDKQIRTTGTIEEPLFVVKDIADILELTNYKNVYSKMENYMKRDGVHFLDSIGRKQEMQVVNESGLYYMIMRSNKPNAKLFQKVVYTDILPSIRKTGSYTIDNKYKFILENNRPLSQVINITDIDKEAMDLGNKFNWSKNTNCSVIYVIYIGEGLVKIGYSDSKFDTRVLKHTSCESKYQQFIILETFEVSGRPIEDTLHNLLNNYRHIFDKQKEIYKPNTTLIKFIEYISQLLDDNDYKLKYNQLLKKNTELENENLRLKLSLK